MCRGLKIFPKITSLIEISLFGIATPNIKMYEEKLKGFDIKKETEVLIKIHLCENIDKLRAKNTFGYLRS